MKYNGNHFKDLYSLAKEESIRSAWEYDKKVTRRDLGNCLDDCLNALFIGTITILTLPIVAYGAYKVHKRFSDAEKRRKKAA